MTNCKKITTKGNPCKNKVFGDTEFCKLHTPVPESESPVKSKYTTIGDGNFEYQGTRKVIKIRLVSKESQTQFLQMMTDHFGKDYSDVFIDYENGLSQDKLVPVNWSGLPPFENDPDEWGILMVYVQTQEQWDWFMNNTKNHKPSETKYSCWYPVKPQEK